MCHKQTDDGRVEYITCIPTTCCGEIFVHNVEIALVTLTTPIYETLTHHKTNICMADPCTKFEVSSVGRCGEITRGVKF